MRRLISALSLALVSSIGCEVENLCEDYITYMCDCHDGSTDLNGDPVDCAEYETVYGDASADQQVYCEDALDAQIEYDAEQGEECEA